MHVSSYRCSACDTEVRGDFAGCPFCRMGDEERYFCLVFIQCEGNMKDVERVMGISYPTVKSRLDKLRRHFDLPPPPAAEAREPEPPRRSHAEILAALEKGDIDFDTAMRRIREET